MAPRSARLFLILCLVSGMFASPLWALDDHAKELIRLGDYAGAGAILARQSEAGDVEAGYQLAKLINQKLVKVNNPAKRAFELYLQVAESGHPEGMYQLAQAYEKGLGVKKNLSSANKWYQAAAAKEHRGAVRSLDRIASSISANPNRSALQAVQTCDAADLKSGMPMLEQGKALGHLALNCENAVAMLKSLKRIGLALDGVDAAGDSILHKAVAGGNTDAVQFLLREGVSRKVKNNQGWTAQMLAERSGDEVLLRLFGIESVAQGKDLHSVASAQQSARFEDWSRLSIAAWTGDVELVSELLKTEKINEKDQTGQSPISRAIARGHKDVVDLLLKHGATIEIEEISMLFKGDSQVQNLLHSPDADFLSRLVASVGTHSRNLHSFGCQAVLAGVDEAVAATIQAGWQMNEPCAADQPLISATKGGHEGVVKTLLGANVDVNSQDSMGRTALSWAIKLEHDEIVSLLWSHGADNVADNEGITPFMWAADQGNATVMRELMSLGVDPNQQDLSGSHALLLAANKGHVESVRMLLDAESVVDLKNSIGDTALIVAVRNGHYETAELLLSNGASRRAKNHKLESALKLAQKKDEAKWQKLFSQGENLWELVQR